MKVDYSTALAAHNRVQDEFLSEMIPEPKRGGRPRAVNRWAVLNAIFSVLVEGVRWRG